MKNKILIAILLVFFLPPIGLIYVLYLLLTKFFEEEIKQEELEEEKIFNNKENK